MGRDLVSRFGLSGYYGMGRNRIWKGYRWDTRVAENALFVSAMCPICLIWGRSSYEMTGFYGTHRCH